VWPREFQEFDAPRFSWHSAHEGGEVVSLTHRPPLPPGTFLVLIFTRGWVDPRAMIRSEGNMSQKNPVTPPGIDPGTVRLVAQRLNHYATPGIPLWTYFHKIWYLITFPKSVEEVQFSIKSEKNNGYFTLSERWIVLHICGKDQKDAHFLLIIYFDLIIKKKVCIFLVFLTYE
jgi:hypothetical protein